MYALQLQPGLIAFGKAKQLSNKYLVTGLSLSADEKALALLYLATVQALAYGTRHIVEKLEASGHRRMGVLLVCGGLSKQPVFLRTQAGAAGRPVAVPRQSEAVLGGAAVLAACAAGVYSSVQEAVMAMAAPASLITPDQKAIEYHNKKYQVYLRMVEDQKQYRQIMNQL